MNDASIRLTINGENDFILTVEDGIAEIRRETDSRVKRNRIIDATIESSDLPGGKGLPITIAVEVIPA